MKKIKIIFVLILIVSSFFLITETTIAESVYRYESEAWQLYRIGLFAGASPDRYNPDLGANLNRQIGITLLLNFFGETPEVKLLSSKEINSILSHYTDQYLLLPWARPYMAYAVKTGMVVGTSPTTLGPLNKLDGVSYAAMILRQLGYIVDREDFINSLQILCEKGGLDAADVDYFNKQELIKDDAVGMVYNSLFVVCSNEQCLIESLINSGKVSVEDALAYNLVRYYNPGSIGVDSRNNSVIWPAGYQQTYDLILDALLSAKTKIVLPKNEYSDSFDEIVDIVNLCLRENPEILYYKSLKYYSNGVLTFTYGKSPATVRAHQDELEKKVRFILAQIIKPDMTDYQKELAVHDYLVKNCDYDMKGFEKNRISDESFTAYGALCLGVAVCEGYSEAASILLNRSGVETRIITGKSKGTGHAWNLVKIDGEWYHLDITWNDPYRADGIKDDVKYHYFNLTDSDISRDHQWDRNGYAACTTTKYNYYRYNNMVVMNQEEFINKVVEEVGLGNKTITLKILESDPRKFSMETAVKTIVNKLYLSCTYSYNQDVGVASISFQ
ncbi:MAG: transglutaminase domain-containing protein [Acetivibrionales bacterium]|jgi:transglutaminase-like putative cysteine protease